MEINVINLIPYLFSNNVIFYEKTKKLTCPTVEIFFNS